MWLFTTRFCIFDRDWSSIDIAWNLFAISVKDGLSAGLFDQHCSINFFQPWSQLLGIGGRRVLVTIPPAYQFTILKIYWRWQFWPIYVHAGSFRKKKKGLEWKETGQMLERVKNCPMYFLCLNSQITFWKIRLVFK